MKKTVKLYNVIFPIWLLWLFPQTWLFVLPGNFLIDLLVVWLVLRYLKVENRKEVLKKTIWKVWLLGFLADIIGTVLMFSTQVIELGMGEWWQWWYEHISSPVAFNPFSDVLGFLWVTVCVLLSGICIYFFNLKISFKKTDLTKVQIKRISIVMAIATAPYLFYLPSAWFYY